MLMFPCRLGTMHNSTRQQAKQEETEKWIKEQFPAVWEELTKLGKSKVENSHLSKFNVEVELKP
jgi:hypothetical protein